MSLKPVSKATNLNLIVCFYSRNNLFKELDTQKFDTYQWACAGMQSGFNWLNKQLKVQSQ